MKIINENELKSVLGGLSASLINALARGANTILGLGQIVGTALRRLFKK